MLKALMARPVTFKSNLYKTREELEEWGRVEEIIYPGRKGLVKHSGTYWKAIAKEVIPVGSRVQVIGMEGLTLVVSPI